MALTAHQEGARGSEMELFGPEEVAKLMEENTGLHINGTSIFPLSKFHSPQSIFSGVGRGGASRFAQKGRRYC